FYPYHYSPLASDLGSIADLNITFEEGVPFEPFQQLLAVLPPASGGLLPEPVTALMRDPLLAGFYPSEFGCDMDGKNWEWEGVVLIPFIDADALRTATASLQMASLTQVEQDRNKLGLNLRFLGVEQDRNKLGLNLRFSWDGTCTHMPNP
ncbi:hypothetical protein T484DRAFT_1782949, partial [Baffinella frigidus]